MAEKIPAGETPEPKTETVAGVVVPEVEKPEEFDEARAKALIAKLRENERQAKKDKARLAELEQESLTRQEAEKTELQKAQDRATKLEAEKRMLEIQVMRRDVASRTKLPDALVDRLKGETPEDMEADALALLAALPTPVPPKLGPTNPGGEHTGETDAERRKRLGV